MLRAVCKWTCGEARWGASLFSKWQLALVTLLRWGGAYPLLDSNLCNQDSSSMPATYLLLSHHLPFDTASKLWRVYHASVCGHHPSAILAKSQYITMQHKLDGNSFTNQTQLVMGDKWTSTRVVSTPMAASMSRLMTWAVISKSYVRWSGFNPNSFMYSYNLCTSLIWET